MQLSSLITIELIDAFGAGVYVLMVATHFDLWLHRRDRATHLWLVLSALGALLVNVTGFVNRALRPEIERLPYALNMLGVAMALVCLFELVQAVSGRRSGRMTRGLQTIAFIPAVVVSAGGTYALTPVLHTFSLGFLVWAMVNVIRDGLRGDIEARRLGAGLLALIATLAYDIASMLKLLPRVEGMPVLGFTLLFLSAQRALSMRYDREYHELLTLRADLELRVQHRTADLEQANRRLDELSRTDELTGLPNRRCFTELAAQAQQRQQRSLQPFAIVMVDVDHFKRVNDVYGHDVGDAALRALAQTLRAALRSQDVVARWGGEEFIALLPDTDRDGAGHAAELVRQALNGIVIPGQDVRLTASFGVAQHATGHSLDATIGQADRALYRAKLEGRDRVFVS